MTTTNQNSVNNENQQKNISTGSSGNNHNQQQQNATVTSKVTKISDSSNNISTSNNNNSNLVKLQSLKLRKFELEQLLNEKTKLLQQIQNQESEIIANGCNPIEKTNLHGNINYINNSSSSSFRRNTENNSFKDRKCLFSTSELPIKSSSLNNFDVFSTKDDVNDNANKSDLLSVSSFNSENSKTKTKEKLWFDSTLDSPILRIDTPNHSNNILPNISTNINDTRSFCQQQRTSSPHHNINSPAVITQTAGIYQSNSNKLSNINPSNPSHHNHHHFNQYPRNNHLHYIAEINSNSPKLLCNDSILAIHDQTKQLPTNSSNNFPISSINNGDACGVNNNYNYYNRYKNHRDRLKLSSQSMSSGSNNYYKMQVIKLEDLSYLSLSTSVLNAKAILSDENSSSELARNKVKNLPTKCLVPNNMEMNLQNLNECSPIQNLQVNNIIQDSGLPPVPQVCNNRWKHKINDNSNNNTIKQQNNSNSSYFMERFSSDVNKSSTLPIFNNSDISFSKPLTPPPRNIMLGNSVFNSISTYLCNSEENGCWQDTGNFINNSNIKSDMKPFNSNTKNYHVIPLTNTIKLSSSSPSPPPLSTILGITSLPETVLATNKTILSTSPEFKMDSPKNVTVVQQATFMPYKEVSKPFEMSDFYKYSTKFRQKDSAVSCFTNNNNNNNNNKNNNNNNNNNSSSSNSSSNSINNSISNNKIISGNLSSNINTNVQKLLNP